MTLAWRVGASSRADGQQALRRMGIGAMQPFGFDRFTALLAVLAALAGTLILLRGMSYGVGIGADSYLYISVAHHLLEGTASSSGRANAPSWMQPPCFRWCWPGSGCSAWISSRRPCT